MLSHRILESMLHYSAILSAVFVLCIMLFAWKQKKEPAFLYWAAAFAATALYQALRLFTLENSLPAEILLVLRAVLLALGVGDLVFRRQFVWLAGSMATAMVWLVIADALVLNPMIRTSPIVLMLSGGYFLMAAFFFRNRPDYRWNGHSLFAALCLIACLGVLFYPFAAKYDFQAWMVAFEMLIQYLLGLALIVILYRGEQVRADESALFHERVLKKLTAHRDRNQQLNQWVETLMEQVSDGVFLIDLNGNLTTVNPAAEHIFGYQAGELKQHSAELLLPERLRDYWRYELGNYKAKRTHNMIGKGVFEWFGKHRAGHEIELEISLSPLDWEDDHHLLAIVRDVSMRKHHEEEITYMADHDGLTDLPNRRYFEKLVAESLTHQKAGWLLFVDMDDFKLINDSVGHVAGDQALKTMARRLMHIAGEDTLIGRQGGDEFVLFISGSHSRETIGRWAEQVISKAMQPITFDNMEFSLSCSLGIAGGTGDEVHSVEQLVRHADLAMYQAKHAGKNRYCFYEPQMLEHFHETAELASRLKNMDMDAELYLVYQPRMRIDEAELEGAEALLRWRSPDGTEYMPDRFIPVAEETGQIVRLGYWVFEQVCAALARGSFNDDMVISVNLSARQLFEENLIEQVEMIRSRYGVSSRQIEFEVTESSAMQNIRQSVDILNRLKHKGYGLSLDDFGTGFSSLSHLRQLPVDVVKIDRSFISELLHDQQDRVMVASIIELAEHLDMRSLAEGVETREQLQLLDSFGCVEAQGYLISRPLPERDFIEQVVKGWHMRTFS